MNKRIPLTVLGFWLGLASARTVSSQASQSTDPVGPFGNLVATDLFGETTEVPRVMDRRGEKKAVFFFSPSLTDTESAFISSLALGMVAPSKTQVDLRYGSIGLDDASLNIDQYRLRVKQKIEVPADEIGLAVVGQWSDTEEVREDLGITVAGSFSFNENLSFVMNVSWLDRRPDAGDSLDDVGGGVGLVLVTGRKQSIALDYTIEDDISGADNYSLAIVSSIGTASQVGFGVAKDSVFFANYSVNL